MRIARVLALLRAPLGAPLLAALALSAAAACGSGDPPPTSPLAETASPTVPDAPSPAPQAAGTPAAPSPAPQATSTAAPGPSPPPAPVATRAPAGAPPPPGGAGSAASLALALMAEWLGVAPAELSVESAEAVVWPSLCIGIDRPGRLCGQALTHGYLVRLRDGAGGRHSLHMRDNGTAEWAGEERLRGVVVRGDGPGSLLVISEGGVRTDVRIAPGSIRFSEDPAASPRPESLAAGAPVELSVDPGPGGGAAVLAWVADLP